MFSGFSSNPIQSMPLTVVTAQLIVHGTIETRLRRLTDVLNEPDFDSLILLDATFMEVGSRRVIAGAAVSQVPGNESWLAAGHRW